jgi:hypothetical protein
MSKTAQHPHDISAALRTQGILVRSHVGRYVGFEGEARFACSFTESGFFRAKGGLPQEPREVQEFLANDSLKEIGLSPKLDAYGGHTEVLLFDVESGAIMGSGLARCSNEDRFSRSLGFKKALRRALKSAKLDNVKFK